MPSLYEYKRMGYTNAYKIDKDIPLDTPKEQEKSSEEQVKDTHCAYKKLCRELKG